MKFSQVILYLFYLGLNKENLIELDSNQQLTSGRSRLVLFYVNLYMLKLAPKTKYFAFKISLLGSIYVHYTAHRTNGTTSHLKDKSNIAIVKKTSA